jgi:U4/U6.U5 tri-snRNP component SNU23
MSSNLKYKQVAQVSRRTWDTEVYEKKAKERNKQAEEGGGKHAKGPLPAVAAGGGDESKEEFLPAAPGAAGPMKSKRAFLKARKNKVDVDSKIGSVEFVNPEAPATSKASVGDATSIKVSSKNKDRLVKIF